MKRYTNNGLDFTLEGERIKIDGQTYYCPNEAWLNAHGWYEYTEQWGTGTDGVYGNKWVHYKGEKPAPPAPPTPPAPTPEELLEQARQQKLAEIEAYDTSDAVNGFDFRGQTMWIDKATRVGIVNAIDATMAMGEDIITFGIQEVSITLLCVEASKMMAELEVYALKCYNVTLQHKREVSALQTIEEINAYDITAGYPEQLHF